MVDLKLLWEDYGLDELKVGIEQLFPKQEINLSHLLEQVMSGDIFGAMAEVFGGWLKEFNGQLQGLRTVLIWLLVLGILASLMSHFMEIFDRHQVSDIGFYFMYLLQMAVLLQCIGEAWTISMETIRNISLFVKLLVPVYLISVGISSGAMTAAASYQLMLFVVYGVESILLAGVLPLINSYSMLVMVNGVWVEEKLTLLIRLLKNAIGWILKGALGVVTGISLFQSLITPVVDSARSSALQSFVSAIPGVGAAAVGVAELILGSAVIIRNSIGVVLLLLLLLLCAVPLVKIGMIAGMIKIAAALMGIVSDKRLTSCVDKVGEAGLLLLRTTGTAMLLFLISIAVTAAFGRTV